MGLLFWVSNSAVAGVQVSIWTFCRRIWLGRIGAGNLKVYGVRFTRQTWPGETLSTRIVVSGKKVTEKGKIVTADVALHNQDGEVRLRGNTRVLAA